MFVTGFVIQLLAAAKEQGVANVLLLMGAAAGLLVVVKWAGRSTKGGTSRGPSKRSEQKKPAPTSKNPQAPTHRRPKGKPPRRLGTAKTRRPLPRPVRRKGPRGPKRGK